MAIHHDKMAYGKLAKTSEELSEEKIAEMLKQLGGEEDETNGRPPQSKRNERKESEKDSRFKKRDF